MLSHLQLFPLQPESECRARPDCLLELPARIVTCCAACTLISLEIVCGSTGPDGITGSLPSEWGSSEAFQLLQTLIIDTCSITGEHGFLENVDAPPDWQCFLISFHFIL